MKCSVPPVLVLVPCHMACRLQGTDRYLCMASRGSQGCEVQGLGRHLCMSSTASLASRTAPGSNKAPVQDGQPGQHHKMPTPP